MAKIHPSAVVDATAQLADTVTVGPNCVIEERVIIGAGSVLGANVVVGAGTRLGENNKLFANCVVGGKPQILGLNDDSQIGGIEIGNGNTIREQVTIHTSMHTDGMTKIGNENLLMIGVHIAHDCILDDKIVMSNYVQISGHCHIQTGVWFSGMVLLHQFITVGKWSYAAGMAGINRDVPPFVIVSGHYPPRVRGVNRRGMVRAGLSEQSQGNVFKAYKQLYRTDGTLLDKAKALVAEDGLDENVHAMLEVIIKSGEHRFGRFLETLR